MTKIQAFNLHSNVDTHIQGLIDSAYVLARSPAGTDSAAVTALIDSASINTLVSTTTITGKIKADIRSNPNALARNHIIDSNSNGLLVGPINVDSGVTLTINGTLMVV